MVEVEPQTTSYQTVWSQVVGALTENNFTAFKYAPDALNRLQPGWMLLGPDWGPTVYYVANAASNANHKARLNDYAKALRSAGLVVVLCDQGESVMPPYLIVSVSP